MKSLTKLLAGAAVLIAVSVHAQSGSPASPAPAASKKGAQLTSAAMLEQSAALQAQVNEDAQHVLHLQQVARDQKDVIKLTCVNDRFVELKASQNMFDQSYTQLQRDKDANVDAMRPSFAQVQQIAGDLKELRNRADACIGVPDLYKQESDVETHHPDFPDDPTGVDPFGAEVEPPSYSSPFS